MNRPPAHEQEQFPGEVPRTSARAAIHRFPPALDRERGCPDNGWVNISGNMGSHMKTTVELSDALLAEARKIAAREGVTVRTLIEQGLRHALNQRRQRGQFRLRKATFKGRGLSATARGAGWEQLRELAYEGRGG